MAYIVIIHELLMFIREFIGTYFVAEKDFLSFERIFTCMFTNKI